MKKLNPSKIQAMMMDPVIYKSTINLPLHTTLPRAYERNVNNGNNQKV